MTVYLSDGRYGDRFVAIRKEFFPDEKFPCSALLTISGFARPGMMIEIQGVAVMPT
jgi:enamine deaminase RidA (YjgF/YER057c/UK114 family)